MGSAKYVNTSIIELVTALQSSNTDILDSDHLVVPCQPHLLAVDCNPSSL